MKQIQQFVICFTAFLFFAVSANAQMACEPDTTTPEVPALYPDSLMDGLLNQAYEQIITIMMPQDSIVDVPPFGQLTIDICSISLDSVPNLPAGLSYECNTPDCIWKIDHDSTVVNRGCVKLSGTPTESVLPDDTLNVFVTINPGAYEAALDSCLPLGINLPPELTSIVYQTRLFITPADGIEDYSLSDMAVQLYPNPTEGTTQLSYELPEAAALNIRLVDIMGRTVEEIHAGKLGAGSYRHTLGKNGLSPGMYMVVMEFDEGVHTLSKKLIIR